MYLEIRSEKETKPEILRRLSPTETVDVRHHVRRWLKTEINTQVDEPLAAAFSEPGSHIPLGCADYFAEIRYTKNANGTCWAAESFFLIPDREGNI